MTKLRRDIHVPNESDAFVFCSASQRGRGLMPGEAAWNAAVAACDVLPILVESEDPANVRVVVGGELTSAEQDEWVGRLTGGLRIPDGRLALCGGAAYVLDEGEWTSDYARIAEVPPGDYRATLHSYASAPNGRLCLEQAGDDEPLGTWFRRTRAGQQMPTWLHNRCVNDPDLDPEGRWKRAQEKRGSHVVDFVLHLEPIAAPAPPPTGDHGFAEMSDCRKPETFPLGLPVDDLEGLDDDAEDAVAPVVDVTDVRSGSERFDLEPVSGGPVEVPVHKIVRVARLAWMCHPYTQPAIRISFPKAAITIEDVDGVVMKREGRELQIGFENTGQAAGAQEAVVAVGKQLRDLPDGSVIALDCARAGKPQGVRPIGLVRFHGTAAAGAWRIDAAFPPVDARLLHEALSVAESLETPRRFVARDEAEAQLIEQRLASHVPEFFQSNPLQRTGPELSVQRRDPAALWQVAVRAFWLRYPGSFPLQDFDLHPPE